MTEPLNGKAWRGVALAAMRIAATVTAIAGLIAFAHFDLDDLVVKRLGDVLTAGGPVTPASPSEPDGEEFSGVVLVVEADLWQVGERWVKLWGIRAPLRTQPCTFPGESEPRDCGRMAVDHLLKHIYVGQEAHCMTWLVGRSPPNMRLVSCKDERGDDVALWLLREGWAEVTKAARLVAPHYVEAMEAAKAARKGMWRARMDSPREFQRELFGQ